MLERQSETERLGRLLTRAREGEGTAAVVRGPAGIGKTLLLNWAASEAVSQGFRVLYARCSELESDYAFGLARNLFEPALHPLPEAERLRLSSGAARFARPALDPSAPVPVGVPALTGDPSAAIINGLYWLSVNLADERPLLAIVDDAQWADALSLRFVHYLGRRVEDLPVLLLTGLRTGEAATSELAEGIGNQPGVEVLEPAPLSAAGVESIVARTYGTTPSSEFLSACVDATSGNPFLVVELLIALADEGIGPTADSARLVPRVRPQTIVRSVLVRLARLPPDFRNLARAASVLGDGASLHHAAELAQTAPARAAEGAAALAAAGMLADRLRLEFVHPLVRSAVYDSIPAAERGIAHAEAAALLTRERAGLDAIAAHLMLCDAHADRHAVATLRAAGRAAIARGAPDAAIAYLRRALAEPPPDDQEQAQVLAELGTAETLARDPAGVTHLEAAYEAITEVGRRGQLAIELGRALMMAGRLDDAVARFERAIDELDDPTDELSLRLEAELITAARLDIRRRAAAAERLSRTAAHVTGRGAAERLVLSNVAFEMVVRGEATAVASQRALLALGDGALLEEASSDSPVYFLAIWALAVCGRFHEAERAVDDALADARRRGSPLGFSMASCFASNVLFRMGRVAEAEASARSVLDVPPEQRWALGLPMGVSFLLDALIERGELDAGEIALADAGIPEEIPELPMLMPLLFSRGKLRLARNETAAGLRDLLLCGERAKKWGSRNPTFLAWRAYAAPVLMAQGEQAHARAIVAEDLELSRAAESPVGEGIALRTAGLLAEGAQGEAMIVEAIDKLGSVGAELEHAKALVELGAWRRRRGQRREAREPLRQGRELARQCAATVLEARAHEELLATGARPRRLALSGVDSLTPSERRVARLAAGGSSNTHIAQELFITRKTVEKHLGSVYLKLDLRSRTQLADVLSRGAAPVPV
jgi:DNA-binding CsgD family transcriptional regulator